MMGGLEQEIERWPIDISTAFFIEQKKFSMAFALVAEVVSPADGE
jgi:hypothetical protein